MGYGDTQPGGKKLKGDNSQAKESKSQHTDLKVRKERKGSKTHATEPPHVVLVWERGERDRCFEVDTREKETSLLSGKRNE